MNREILLQSLEDFMQETDARLTALEAAKTQAPESVSQLRALVDENHRLEMAVYHAKADLDEAEANSKRLEAEVDDLLELCNALDARLTDELSAARAERDNLAAERKRLAAENAKLRTENDVLRRDYGIKRRQYDEMQAALKALQNDLR